MKKIILLTFLVINLFAKGQKWIYSAGVNAFDGPYKTSSIRGTGGEFPYQNPRLAVNLFEKDNNLNMYFANAGYAGCDNKKIYFKFDGESKVYSFYSTTNSDKDVWFVSYSSYYDYELTRTDLLEKFMNHSYVNVRLSSSCGQSDYKFSLSGSTAAINYVAKEWIKEERMKEEKLAELNEQKKLKAEQEKLIADSIRQKRAQERELKAQLEMKKKDSLNSIFNNKVLFLKATYRQEEHEIMVTKYGKSLYKKTIGVSPALKIPANTLLIIDSNYLDKYYFKVLYVDNEGEVDLYISRQGVIDLDKYEFE